MKKILLILLIYIVSLQCYAQPYSIDQSFTPTYSFWDGGPYYGTPGINTVIERSDGKVYIAGKFSDITNYTSISNIALLNSNGSVDLNFVTLGDPDFSTGGIFLFNDTIYSIYTYGLARHDGNTGDFDWTFADTVANEIFGQWSDIEILDDGTMFIAMDGTWHIGQPEEYFYLMILFTVYILMD